MKKWIFYSITLIVVAAGSFFLLIPSSIEIAGFTTVNCPSASIGRIFEQKGSIKKWWPGIVINDSVLSLQDTRYFIKNSNSLSINLIASFGNISLTAEIAAILLKKDSSAIQWKYQAFNTRLNPIARIASYQKALVLKKQMKLALDGLKQFADSTQNIYGISIVASKVKDSSLISTKKAYSHIPTNQDISELVQILKQYIVKNGGIEKDYPMLNIRVNEENKYEAMVAIPLEKDIPIKGDIIIKKMVLGNILIAKVTGGQVSIAHGEAALKAYAKDYGKISPAIPFQQLVTDRFKETDTSKWITYLKYPVF